MFGIKKPSAGLTLVEVSANPSDQEMVSACMTVTPGYAEWCKEQIALGNEIHTMTVAEMLDRYSPD